ncbi:G8 domain-containing protein DDB_G0286311-like [Perca fluviatilis]|uniref:G8 domain-containing protein DDB_G0286311-like n=1 Tax=Perca fluviatilis TaxID=8168 RepID=UPI0019667B50|nr:G8 domain-containing protein DDB_G0286311-like [Perca fluviatilis]
MRVNIYLLVLVLGYKAAAGIIHEIVEEKTPVTLPCPHSVEGDVTWSRERNGDKTDILTVNGGREIKHISGNRYSSLADKTLSLFIVKAVVSDSGRYFCNNEAAANLTVIPSGTTIVPAPERTSITLTCPHDVGASHVPTWTRDSGGIPLRRFDVSPVDQTLTITDVQPGDSGLYYCDGKPAVYLNVIEAALSPTEAKVTTVPSTPPRSGAPTTTTPTTTIPTTTTPKTTTNTPTTATTTQTTTTTTTTGNTPIKTTTNAADPQPLIRWVFGVVVSFLLLLLLLLLFLIIVFINRRRFKRRGNEERSPIYEEIQDGFVLQPTNGGGTLTAQAAANCMADVSDGSNRQDPTYDTIPDLPPVKKKTVTSLPNESPYSLIGDHNKGFSQLADSTYCLLEKPKATANDQNQ